MPLRSLVAAFVMAALVSVTLTPLVRLLAFRLGAVSAPGGRHIHRQKTPRLGGVAIYAGMLVSIVVLSFSRASIAGMIHAQSHLAFGMLIGGTIMCGTGFVDDTRGLRAMRKLWLQIGAASVAFAFGFRIEAISLPLIGDVSMGIFALPVTVAWIVGIINAVNLIDGLDGLAAGVVFFAGLTNFVVAYFTESTFVSLVMATMLGAVLGFLFFNFNPARIFMGDSGSYLLGFVLATSSLAGALQKASTAVSLMVPVLALGVPIIDTLFALVRRYLERRPIFAPDRGHIHHRLLELGLTHRRAVLIIYGVCVVFTVAAISLALGRAWQAGLAILVASVSLTGLVRAIGWFEYVHLVGRQKARVRSRDTEMLRYSLPSLPAALEAARDQREVWAVFEEFLQAADLSYAEVAPIDGGEPLVRVHHPHFTPEQERDLVTSSFPIGRDAVARTRLKFGWRSELAEVSPQTDILLQVAVDVLCARLSQLRSDLAPASAVARAAVQDDESAPASFAVRPSRP